MADNVYFEFEELAKGREAVEAAVDRSLSAVLEESEAQTRVRVPRTQLMEAEVLMLRHGGHLVQDGKTQQ